MSPSLFQLPDEIILTPVLQSFPCREQQIRSLATLLYPSAAPCRNLTIHGVEATGKTAVTTSLLRNMTLHNPRRLRHAIVSAGQCITSRHLFERIVSSVAEALDWSPPSLPPHDGLLQDSSESAISAGGPVRGVRRRCETLSQLNVELSRMLKYEDRGDGFRFVLVLDGLDKARDPPPTLVPAMARLSEIIPCLTTIFIVTSPPAHHLRTPSSPTLHFPPYDKSDYIQILSLTPPATPILPPNAATTTTTNGGTASTSTGDQDPVSFLWPRFCAAVHDALVRSAARSLPQFRSACELLWPRFIAPVEKGMYQPREFSKLLVAARQHFQDETVLNPSIVSVRPSSTSVIANGSKASTYSSSELAALLPITARILLMCAYLASHNAPRHDLTLFSTYHTRRRRRGGATSGNGAARANSASHRKIARKLLGAQAFVLERMLAIFAAVRTEWIDDAAAAAGRGKMSKVGLDGDVGMALATLASLRLLSRVGVGGDVMDRGGKWRINVGWEVVRGVGRSMGVEVEEWLIE